MCAGHPPFRAGSTPAVLRRVCDEQPRPIREVNSDVPVWLSDVIERLHAKDPAGRFQSATELAVLLERALAALQRGLPIVHVPHQGAVQPCGRRRRNGAITAVLSISALALALLPWAGMIPELDDAFRAIRLAFASPAPAGSATGGQDVRVIINDPSQTDRIVGSGISAIKNWDVSDFTSVEIRATFHAQISKGNRFKVSTTADENVLPFVRVVKEGNTLKIGLEKNKSYEFKKPLEAEITLPLLTGLDVSGVAWATLKGFESEKELTIKTSGASKVDGSIGVAEADFEISDASTLSVSGSAQSARLSAHGASHLTLPEFPLKECTLDLAEASTAQLSVRSPGTFSAKLNGASHLKGTVVAKDIKLELTGASHAKLGGAATDANAGPDAHGQSKSSASSSNAQTLKKGGGSGSLPGKCKTATIEAQGASHLNLEDLVIETAEIKLSGASHAVLNVTEKLSYEASSGSHLRCLGNPSTRNGKSSSGSHVSFKSSLKESQNGSHPFRPLVPANIQ